MKVHRIKGDGNCLFASCGYHLNTKPCCLRSRVARTIRDHPFLMISGKSLLEWIEMAGYDPMKYSQRISQSGVMGTGIELAIIALLYRRTVQIYQIDKEKLNQIAEYFPEFGHPILLLFSGPASGGHYDALI